MRGIAYLVLAHDQPAHLIRLIHALDDPSAWFFVHIDAKSDVRRFDALRRRARVTMLEERERVHWGGYSQVKATLRLLRAAVGERFARYSLVSGADFPIKSHKEIREILLGSNQEFLRVDRKLAGHPRNGHFSFVERFYLNDIEIFNPKPSMRFRSVQNVASRLFRGVTGRLPPRRFFQGMTPYHGSQWWSLTDACVRHVLGFLDDSPGYERFHHFVQVPDEVFFHTIVKASPFSARISHDFEARPIEGNEYGSHYIDWAAKGVVLPKVLVEADLPALIASPVPFARKFDERVSAGLLDLLEQRHASRTPVASR